MDAAMGTALLARKIDPLRAPLTHPEAVASIHASHVAAGAELVLTCTFQANPITLGEELEPVGQAAVRLARASGASLVLGTIGPMGSPREFPSLAALAMTAEALRGVDAVLLETCSSPDALQAAAFLHFRLGLTVWLSLAYRHSDGRLLTRSGHGPEVFARHAARHGVAALGVNCGNRVTPEDCSAILDIYRQEVELPVFARPNAGPPGEPMYPLSSFAALMADWVGGCCGATAEHLNAIQGRISSQRG
jgi:5-methyltetrahydrofolate--homocysteine methyltransferase